jgi:hypothetical protein
MESENNQLIANLIYGIVMGFLLLIPVAVFIASRVDKKNAERYPKSMAEANARYGVNLTWDDVLIFKKYSDASQSRNVFQMPTYVGPRGDNTINIFMDGNLIPNVSLEDNKGDWVLKSNGVELPRVKA